MYSDLVHDLNEFDFKEALDYVETNKLDLLMMIL